MKLITNCDSCKEEISIKSNSSTRPELAMEKGDEFNINCANCGNNSKKHVNDVRAVASNTIAIGGLIISILITVALWNIAGLVGTISITIPLIIWQQQNKSVHTFNSYRTRR